MTQPQPSKTYDARQELKYFSILLRRAAVSAILMIREFLNSITSIPQKSIAPSVDSSQPDTVGAQKSSAPKSESAEYYVRTAIGNTHLSSKTITPTPRSSMPCEKSTGPSALSPERCEEIRVGLLSGKLDLHTVSLLDWMHVSYLSLFNKQETHMQQSIVYDGNVYNLHFCVSSVVPPAQPEKLREKQ